MVFMKKTTKDDYCRSVNKVTEYIEKNYAADLTLDTLSRISGFSKYHFHRIFLAVTGESLNAFVRRVRLSKSTGKLANDLSVTEVAMQSGYETPAAFARAFKEQYGLSPKAFAKNIKEQKGDAMIDARIIDFEPVEVLYVRKRGDYEVSAGEAFEVLFGFAYAQKIKYHKNLLGKETRVFGIGHDDPNMTAPEDLRYDACISYDDQSVKPEGEVGIKTIEGGRHLSFLHKGPYEELKKVYSDLMAYIIEHGITMADRPPFERYLNRDPGRTKPENLKTEIYIPIEA